MGTLSLEDALRLVVLYAEAEDDKFDKAAVRWLGRLLAGAADDARGGRAFGGARQSVARAWGRVVCWGA